MKWYTIVFMAMVFAVCQPNTVNFAGANAAVASAKIFPTSARMSTPAADRGAIQRQAGTNKYVYEGKGVQSAVASTGLLNSFSLHEQLQKLFTASNTSKQSKQSPEPAMLFLFGSGLAGCIFIFRRRMSGSS